MREIIFPKGWAPLDLWISRLRISGDYRHQELEQKVMEMTRLVKGCVKEINRQGSFHLVFHKRIVADVLIGDGIMEELQDRPEIPELIRVGAKNV
ncbi:MAG: hypothetical protein HRU19_12360 [Pseudobacteriovorax sp.]|nr:hypothetical protein [Pseudobacteriovorax sp.]